MKKRQVKKEIKDQFYTNPGISSYCLDVFKDTIDIDHDDILLEPSAGNRSFSDILIEQCYNVDAYDIEPKRIYKKTGLFRI